jgi:K(+)-stimulated pyrophosphate-energized sodium pump
VLTPVIIGFGIGYTALGAFLAAVILVGQLMANYLSNAGGAWDNAKKYIEDGKHGGKGSEAHKAAVIGDTVGDPFKDTAGPALNPLIKVMNLVSLLILPAVINLSDIDSGNWLKTTPKPAALAIAAVALVILLGSIAFSKRSGAGIATDDASSPATATNGSGDSDDAAPVLADASASASSASTPAGSDK